MIKRISIENNSDLNFIKNRNSQILPHVEQAVAEIIGRVKNEGDSALFYYNEIFDNVKLSCLEVTREEIDSAYESVDDEFIRVLLRAKKNIKAYHKKQVKNGFVITEQRGITMGQRVIALDKVGIYVPGGTASYPSTVLMNALPAKIAGVNEIIMVSPPSADGNISKEILTAAKIAGVDRVFKAGGAQAVAALAFGTESVPKVDKITGPGNIYVAAAKRQVFGTVDIDMIAGPSDVLIIADESAKADFVAADMLAQAEHDKLASAVLLTMSDDFAIRVAEQIEIQLQNLSRKEIAGTSIANNGMIIVAKSMEQMIEIANLIAPEHLELCVEEPFSLLPMIKNAGSVFLGNYTPEALGDYMAGPNHTLPTEGTARFSSGLSVDDFVKKSSFLYYDRQAFAQIGKDVAYFADKEGLEAHGKSAEIRLGEKI